jgi:RNA polymerase sigma-70 factor (sigma-E family)
MSCVDEPEDGPALTVEAAFDEFVLSRSTHLLRLALLLTGWNEAEAQDLTQIALERAYRRRRMLFGRDRTAEPYVRKVLVNAAIDWRRSVRRRRELPLEAAANVAIGDQTGGIGDRDLLLRALDSVPSRQRAVLVLRFWEDLSDTEIATMLNCSLGTVKSQAARGLSRLRTVVGAGQEPAGAGSARKDAARQGGRDESGGACDRDE